MTSRVWKGVFVLLVLTCGGLVWPLSAQRSTVVAIDPDELRGWLTAVSSDAMQGRQIFTEGAGIASAYIADQLRASGVEPAGDNGTYFQAVRVVGVRNRGTSTVTVTVRGKSRTFRDGEGVRFPRNQGVARVVEGAVEFVGYGLDYAPLGHHDYAGRDVAGKVVVYIGRSPQAFTDAQNRLVGNRALHAVEQRHAIAAFGPTVAAPPNPTEPLSAERATRPDFQTAQRLDLPRAPRLTADDEFLSFVFSESGYDYADLKARAERREALPLVALTGVRMTVDIQADYDVVQTRLSRNVVARVAGSDPLLRETHVVYGAHYDHVGYAEVQGRRLPDISGMCPGLTRTATPPTDIVFNGADDDGSGVVTLLALAKAFASGPPPRRSVSFVWHTGEEAGLYGSQFMADHPMVPTSAVAAQLNIDMVGRNKCDDPAEGNTVYLVGSDRISSELHEVNERANASLDRPMSLDYSLNDPGDLESLYTRSDHYSYASKGIPIIFFTTGLHSDYHAVTDEVERIDFDKMARIAHLVYQTGLSLANLDHLPVRDNQGPRAIGRAQRSR